MESSGIRCRNVDKEGDISKKSNTSKKLDIIGVNAYNYFDGHYRVIKTKPYGDYKEKLYQTLKDGFIIKDMNDDSYQVIGRLVNNNIISLTDYEQEICLSEGFSLGDTSKYQ